MTIARNAFLQSCKYVSAFAKAYPDKVVSLVFKLMCAIIGLFIISLILCFRNAWFTEDDIKQLAYAGINTVRIPVSLSFR